MCVETCQKPRRTPSPSGSQLETRVQGLGAPSRADIRPFGAEEAIRPRSVQWRRDCRAVESLSAAWLHNTCVTTQKHAKVDQRTPVTPEIPAQAPDQHFLFALTRRRSGVRDPQRPPFPLVRGVRDDDRPLAKVAVRNIALP